MNLLTWIRNNKLAFALYCLIALAATSAIWNWYKPQPTIQRQFAPAPEAKETAQIERETVPVKSIQAINKEKAAKRLNLPPSVKEDKSKAVTSTAEVTTKEGRIIAANILDTSTGVSEIYTKEEKSFFGFPSNKEIGIRYGASTEGMEGNIYGRWQFLRAGNAYLGAYGEIDTSAKAKAMVDLSFQW